MFLKHNNFVIAYRDQQTTGNMERELNCYALVNIASFMGLFTIRFTREHVNCYKNRVEKVECACEH